MTTRRSLVTKGLLGGALLAIGGTAWLGMRSTLVVSAPIAPLRLLTLKEYAVLAAIAARVVPGPRAATGWPMAQALDVAGKIDGLLALLHPQAGQEFRQVLRLFENGLTGLLTTGQAKPFTRMDGVAQDDRLEAWRLSHLALLRTGYQALARLCRATYYSSPQVYALMGYPGPPTVSKEPL